MRLPLVCVCVSLELPNVLGRPGFDKKLDLMSRPRYGPALVGSDYVHCVLERRKGSNEDCR